MVFETQVTAHREVAKGTHEVSLQRPSAFAFQAGQYLQIALPKLTTPDSKGASRLFSVASSPYDMDKINIVFKSSGSGFKETLINTPVGSLVQIDQAAGSFLLPQKLNREHVFIAGGVGIAPFMSYLQQKIAEVWEYQVTLFYGNQNPESAAYLSELKRMSKQQRQFLLNDMYQRPTPDLFVKLAKKYKDAVWWVVGPPSMVATAVNGLRLGGVTSQDIVTESFDGY
jgi:ferredoxin-NADP reductase